MALSSPGVQVTIIDQSQYLPAASSSVPFVILATAENKVNAAGTGVAAATTAANANKLYQVTSQRDLVNLFGNPFFYKTTSGTSIHGYELNEYGLLAAYSLLGTTNRAFVLRADIDLAGLVGQLSRPVGAPANDTYWLDTTNTLWGIYEFNATTGKFTNKLPIVISDTTDVSANFPKNSIGNIGDYAVIAYEIPGSDATKGTYFYKSINNEWVKLGSGDWQQVIPTIKGTISSPTGLAQDTTFNIQINGGTQYIVRVPAQETVASVANAINTALEVATLDKDGVATTVAIGSVAGLSADVVDGALCIYLDSSMYDATNSNLAITTGTFNTPADNPLNVLGITTGVKYNPEVSFGTSAQMPLWTSSQQYPHPTGSVWIKTSSAGTGLDLVLNNYSTSTASWGAVDVPKYINDATATNTLDSSGGKAIPQGTVYAQYSNESNAPNTVLKYWERVAVGPTVVTGTVTNPTVPTLATISVMVSVPGSSTMSSIYTFSTSGATATTFVTNWQSANIPYTTASVTTDGAVQLTHTLGGQIAITDIDQQGDSAGVLEALGFDRDSTAGVKFGSFIEITESLNPTSTTSADGDISDLLVTISAIGTDYLVNSFSAGLSTKGFAVGDLITFAGTNFGGVSPTNDVVLKVADIDSEYDAADNPDGGVPTALIYNSGTSVSLQWTQLSNWVELTYIANEGAPATLPANGTNWFYSTATQVDIMVNKNGAWKGYGNVAFDSTGHPSNSGSPSTNASGPILSTTSPTTQSDGTPLEYGDLWLNTGDLENYPVISRWQDVEGVPQWVLIDNADQTTQNGILFADARWGTSGSVDPVSDPLSTIASLLTSDYLDLDAPNPALYPQGMLLFNTRRSGYNVKTFTTNYFTSAKYPNGSLPDFSYTWVSSSGLKSNGAAYMGRKAQRNMVVQAMKSAIGTNQTIREEDTFFNLISAPGYPELQPDMVTLNNDRNNTAYIIGDTPLRLPDQATNLTNWATNAAGAAATGEDGWVTRDSYLGVFYPSGITTDLTGAEVVVPASHMMLRTFLRNDTIAYPWLAAAGTRRGLIDNATNIGYLDAATGEFITIKNRMSIRDVLYTNQINPLAYFTGVGLLNYGNKNSFDSQSALDRTNVARLIAYIRERVQVAARPFVFEPNDALTRGEISNVIQTLFIDLVAKRGLYDYLVVCDESNNTPARIDRNELWVDIAIEPVKAAEFIYIPVRILNTGELNG